MIRLIPNEKYHSSTCLRVGFRCQRIWFGFVGPNWFCQTTYPAQLCGFGMRVSSSDFYLWWSFWSQLHYLQKCTAGKFCVSDNVTHIGQFNNFSATVSYRFGVGVGVEALDFKTQSISRYLVVNLFPRWISRSSMRKTTIQSNNFRLYGTVRHWSLFLTHLMGTDVRLPKIQRIHHEFDLETSTSPTKSRSCNKPHRQCCAVFPTNLPLRAKYKHFKNNCDQTFDNSPTDSSSSFLKLVIIQTWSWDFVHLINFLLAISQHPSTHCFAWRPYQMDTRLMLREISPTQIISAPPPCML